MLLYLISGKKPDFLRDWVTIIPKDAMARLLENQAKELLRESSTMAGGDVEGFAAVAFPIVRRVFGNLIANDLVSVQPMSLPSGLIFFLDFTVSSESNAGVADGRLGYPTASSLYDGDIVGQQITGGVNRTGDGAEQGPYNLNNGYSSPTSSVSTGLLPTTVMATTALEIKGTGSAGDAVVDKAIRFDPDLSGSGVVVVGITGSSCWSQLDVNNLVAITCTGSFQDDGQSPAVQREQGWFAYDANGTTKAARLIRRLSSLHSASVGSDTTNSGWKLQLAFEAAAANEVDDLALQLRETDVFGIDFPIDDNFTNSTFGTPGGVVGTTSWELEDQAQIPEIDIKSRFGRCYCSDQEAQS